jgi:hypothetical protein
MQGSPAKIVAPTHWNPDQPQKNKKAPPPVLSPSGILPSFSSHFASITQKKKRRGFKNVIIQISYIFKLRKSEIV